MHVAERCTVRPPTAKTVALCDWRVSPLGGLEGLKSLQREGHGHLVPVIVLTAYGDAESTVQAMQAGAHDFLVKPVDVDAVLSTVTPALEHVACNTAWSVCKESLSGMEDCPSRSTHFHAGKSNLSEDHRPGWKRSNELDK